ncbi:protein artichoke-like [Patiria miniata]|uniref:Peptidase S1 domain-containing protein n=1 Tax=Patiria miniata TaxID=46514 RepID=A0A914AVS7_PATMI|nr:protein artichoke-like [Patiria miniata]
MRITTSAIFLCFVLSVISLTQRVQSRPLPGAQPRSCPMKCRCVTVSKRLLAVSRRLQNYAAMFDWKEGAGAAVCWGKREVPTELLSGVSYLLLIGDDSRMGIIDYDMTSFGEVTVEPDVEEESRIKRIPPGTFANGAGLVHLDIRGNKITDLEPDSFVGLEDLEILSIKANRLRALPQDALHNVQSLMRLYLSGNHIRTLPEGSFINNTNLLDLDLGANLLESLSPRSLKDLSHLRFLNMSHNRLDHLPEELLVDLVGLQQLILDDNKIESLPENFFAMNSNLKVVSLKNNRLQQLPQSVFIYLTNLLELDLSGSNLIALGESMFSPVSVLQYLNVSHNSLTELNKQSFENCTDLRILIASSNKLSEITGNTFGQLPSLQELVLDGNEISVLPPGSLRGLTGLEILDLTNNALRRLQAHTFYGLERLTSLRLDNNEISEIEPGAFSVGPAYSMSKLTWLFLRGNHLRELTPDMFKGAPFVKMLNLAENKISVIQASFLRGLRRLVALSLHGNRLASLQERAFSDASNVQSLDLSGNFLHQVDYGAFLGFDSLLELNMADNELDETTCDWLDVLTSLNVLNLRGNRFARVPAALLTSLPDLTQLSLKRNILDTFRIPEHDRTRGLSRLDIADNNLQTIEGGLPVILAPGSSVDLSGNPWLCDCALVSDVREMTSEGTQLENVDETLCRIPGQETNQQELMTAVHEDSTLCGLQELPALSQSDGLVKSSKTAQGKSHCKKHAFVSKANNTWPMYAVVWNAKNKSALCNAALIGVDWAVTTLRCLEQIQHDLSSSVPNIFRDIVRREQDSLLMAPPGLVARLGKRKHIGEFEADEQAYGIMNIHIPANDRGAGLDRPVLLQFGSLAALTEQVFPACIADSSVKVQSAIALGWGQKRKGTPRKVALQSSRMSLGHCGIANDVINEGMLCGVRARGKSIEYSIDGNMGGALVMKRGRGDWVLVGLGTRIDKGQSMFIDLTQHVGWIDHIIERERSRNN